MSQISLNKNFSKQALLKRFALIYLPVAIVLSIGLLLSARYDEQKLLATRSDRENNEINVFKGRVEENFEMVNSDLRVTAALPQLRSYLDSGSPALRDELAQIFLAIVKEKQIYDKVLFLDGSGHEVIRVNYNDGKPVIVPREQLQNKSERYYFQDANKLNKGEIFVSPLDLNVEKGRLEIPHKPIIRFGTPLFDSSGSKKGLLLFSYYGNDLLFDFHQILPGGDHIAMLLNRDGFWLSSSANHADEWAFNLGKSDRTFGHDFEDEWRIIFTNEKGVLRTTKGLFAYSTLHPLLPGQYSSTGSNLMGGPSQQALTAKEYYWKIVSFTPQDILSGAAFYNRTSSRVLLVFIYLLFAAAAWVVAVFTLGRERALGELRIAATTFESQEGLLVTDAEGVVLRINKAYAESTGYTPEEVVGTKQDLLKTWRQVEDFAASIEGSINRTGSWQGESLKQHKNGEIYPIWLTITAVKADSGAVSNYVWSHIDISEKKAAEKEIKKLAFYDSLTQLPNRNFLMDRLKQAMSSITRKGQHGALLLLDLDNFKNINDTLGHGPGDLLLQQVAKRLTSCVRGSDTVARLGGDEFVVMLAELSKDALEAAAETDVIAKKLLAALNQPYQLESQHCHSSSSIGVILFNDDQHSNEELFKQADIAMYHAKSAGRNTLRFFDPAMEALINARSSLEGALRAALERQQLHLHYQVQVDDLLYPIGAEVLIRWAHPELGMVSPAQFIPLAEETGLILPIGQWVLESACAQIKTWQKNELTCDLVLAVNVSAKQFRQDDFVTQVLDTVKRHQINPKLLKLELTESMLLDDIEGIIAPMKSLQKIGVQFSLDDFGTGYSSLQYLKQLPLNQLKIDQSFVRDIVSDSSDRAIVNTIIAMAHSLNLNVIAEGVETEEQQQYLLDNGCREYQGYLFSKPVPVDQFEALLKRHEELFVNVWLDSNACQAESTSKLHDTNTHNPH